MNGRGARARLKAGWWYSESSRVCSTTEVAIRASIAKSNWHHRVLERVLWWILRQTRLALKNIKPMELIYCSWSCRYNSVQDVHDFSDFLAISFGHGLGLDNTKSMVTWSILSLGWTFLSSLSSWQPPNWRPEGKTSQPHRWCTCRKSCFLDTVFLDSWPELGVILEWLRRVGWDRDQGEQAGELHQPPGHDNFLVLH